jgi:hypothetical protein
MGKRHVTVARAVLPTPVLLLSENIYGMQMKQDIPSVLSRQALAVHCRNGMKIAID